MDGRDHAKRKLSRDAMERERGRAFSVRVSLSLFSLLLSFFSLFPQLIRRRKPGEREGEGEKKKGRVRSLISVVVVEARCD